MIQLTLEQIALAGLAVLVIVFIIQNFILRKKLKEIFKGGTRKNLESVLEEQIKKTDKLEQEVKKHLEDILNIKSDFKKATQKVEITRFNSLDESGSNQSFSLVALDGQNNGYVLTGLYLRDNVRFYIKPIEKGAPKYKLSKEEEETLEKAMKS